jgi:hypothetical protein
MITKNIRGVTTAATVLNIRQLKYTTKPERGKTMPKRPFNQTSTNPGNTTQNKKAKKLPSIESLRRFDAGEITLSKLRNNEYNPSSKKDIRALVFNLQFVDMNKLLLNSELNQRLQRFTFNLSVKDLYFFCSEFQMFHLEPATHVINVFKDSEQFPTFHLSPTSTRSSTRSKTKLREEALKTMDTYNGIYKNRARCLTWLLMRNDVNILKESALFRKEVTEHHLLNNIEVALYLIKFCIHYNLEKSLGFVLSCIKEEPLRQLFINPNNKTEIHELLKDSEHSPLNLLNALLNQPNMQSNMAVIVFLYDPRLKEDSITCSECVDEDKDQWEECGLLDKMVYDLRNPGHKKDIEALTRRNAVLGIESIVSDSDEEENSSGSSLENDYSSDSSATPSGYYDSDSEDEEFTAERGYSP